tara:strand:+ start:78 stop:515 length:438 start_codon:yes stop_codon:yes gene_type:complete
MKKVRTFNLEAKVKTLAEAVELSNKIKRSLGEGGIFDSYENEIATREKYSKTPHYYVTTEGEIFGTSRGDYGERYIWAVSLITAISGGYKKLMVAKINDYILTEYDPELELDENTRWLMGTHKDATGSWTTPNYISTINPNLGGA